MAQVELPPGVPAFEEFVKQRQTEIRGRKEKKRGGIPFWPNFAAVKGMGASAQLGVAFASKIGLLAVFAAFSAVVGAGGLWHRMQLQQRAEEFKKKQFETSLLRDNMLHRKGPSSMSSAVPTVDGVRGDTIGFVKAGELAMPSADAAAAAAAAAANGAKEGDGANGADGAGKGDGQQAAPDPNAMAAEMMAQAGAQAGAGAKGGAGAGSGGFGKLSSGLGGMRGGGGMSGGVGRGFDQNQMKNSMLAKAQAMKGGSDPSILSRRGRTGKARSWMGNRHITAGARSAASANKLRQMAADMSANRNADVTKANTANTAAWEAASAPTQQVAGPPAIGPTSQSGGSFGGPEAGEGGPVISAPNPSDIDTGANVPTVPAFENVTPYQWAVDLAKMLCVLIVVLALIAAICQGKAWFEAVHAYVVGAIGILGGILALLGVYMIAMGQYWQGTMYTLLGSIVAITALAVPSAEEAVMMGSITGISALIGAIFAQTANDGDNADDEEQHKKDYEKKYGVKWDNNRDVINHEKWDERYGKNSAKNYEEQGKFDDMR